MYNLIIPGARFYNQLDAALTHNDIIEAELSKEIESARLFRLLTKLCTVVDRAELNGDFGWAEYGDRYMLKLFRDYIFHQVCSLFWLTFFLLFINILKSQLPKNHPRRRWFHGLPCHFLPRNPGGFWQKN